MSPSSHVPCRGWNMRWRKQLHWKSPNSRRMLRVGRRPREFRLAPLRRRRCSCRGATSCQSLGWPCLCHRPAHNHSQRSRKPQSLWQSSGVSLPSPELSEASAIRGRCRAGCLAKSRRERTRFAEADRQRNLGDRACWPRQQRLGVVDATSVVIAVGRHAERPLEGPAEMVRAQPNTVREGSERYLLGDVFFDIRGHDPLLPGGETAARRRFDAARSSAAAHELMRQHGAECLAVMPIVTAALDQPAQFDRGVPQRLVFEEQAWRQGRVRCACCGIDGHFGGIEIEINDAAAGAGLSPLAIFMTRRHKGELAFDISQRRTGQTLDQRLAVFTNAPFVGDKQVHRRAKAKLDLLVSDRVHDLDGHAVPCQTPAGDRIGWKNSDCLIDDLAATKIGERPGPDTARLLAVLARARIPVRRPQRRLRNKCNVAIETRAVVKARMYRRVRAERVSQHGLHRQYLGTSGRNPAAVVAPVSLKLGRPTRTAPSYGGRPAYRIGLSALYLGLGRQGLGRHAVVAMTRRGRANGMRLAPPAQSFGAPGTNVGCLRYRAMLAGSMN